MTLNRNKRNLKIIRLYIVGLLCIVFFFLLDNSNIILELVEKSSKLRYNGFATFLLTGLIKYGLFIIGICIVLILSFMLIKEKIKNK